MISLQANRITLSLFVTAVILTSGDMRGVCLLSAKFDTVTLNDTEMHVFESVQSVRCLTRIVCGLVVREGSRFQSE